MRPQADRDVGQTAGADTPRSPAPGDLRRNFRSAALSGALFEGGAAFVDTGTVVAAFINRLTRSAVAVGAAEAIARVGWLLPQLLVANYAQGVRYRKPLYLAAGWGRALCLGLLAAILLVWPDPPDGDGGVALLAAFFALWTLFSFVSGVAGVPYNDVIGRTIPSDRRSRLLAIRMVAGGVLGIGAGVSVRAVLQRGPEGSLTAYGLIFGAGAVILALSTLGFAAVREPPAPLTPARVGFVAFVAEGVRVLRRDARFRLFVWVQLLAGLTTMATPFYLLQARRVSGVAEAEVGSFVAAQMLGTLVCTPLWGWWGDRRGKLGLLKAVGVTSVISPTVAILLPWGSGLFPPVTVPAYAVVFFGLGAVAGGRTIADLGYLMEISPDERRPEYSGYLNVLVAPSRLLPLVAGSLVTVWSFPALFSLAAVAALVRLGVLSRLGRAAPAPPGPGGAGRR